MLHIILAPLHGMLQDQGWFRFSTRVLHAHDVVCGWAWHVGRRRFHCLLRIRPRSSFSCLRSGSPFQFVVPARLVSGCSSAQGLCLWCDCSAYHLLPDASANTQSFTAKDNLYINLHGILLRDRVSDIAITESYQFFSMLPGNHKTSRSLEKTDGTSSGICQSQVSQCCLHWHFSFLLVQCQRRCVTHLQTRHGWLHDHMHRAENWNDIGSDSPEPALAGLEVYWRRRRTEWLTALCRLCRLAVGDRMTLHSLPGCAPACVSLHGWLYSKAAAWKCMKDWGVSASQRWIFVKVLLYVVNSACSAFAPAILV